MTVVSLVRVLVEWDLISLECTCVEELWFVCSVYLLTHLCESARHVERDEKHQNAPDDHDRSLDEVGDDTGDHPAGDSVDTDDDEADMMSACASVIPRTTSRTNAMARKIDAAG